MHKHELPELSQRLAQLADALQGKAPSPAGLLVWGDALSECARDDVLAVLSDWPKSHAKMPLPNEVLKLCRERVSARIESRAAEYAKDNHKPWSPQELRGSSEVARRELAKIRAILAKPKRGPKEWATRILAGEYPNAGDYAYALARSVAGVKPADEEARLEREAIQAEEFA